MLSVSNLEVVYNDVILVLRGVSLEVREGSIVALLGANGAGKTTLLRAMTGLLDVHDGKVTKGQVTLNGQNVTSWDAPKIVAAGLGQVLEGRRVFSEFTVEENLRVGGHTRSGGLAEPIEQVYELFPVLKERRRRTAGYLSGGEQQMLAIGRALIAQPQVLLLDEPSLGLAPKIVQQIKEIVVEINQRGTTVLLVEQNATMALSIAQHGFVMEHGKIVMDKPAAELLEDDDIRDFYLGRGESATSYRNLKHYKRRKRWLS
ncbi:ABC transporter, ATP-binding protein [Aeromicrobium marinum DSM 15272]|uniref:ABC transporter, ATP-binding protein n=1 Tax=Aeromicrobium marinum DSM 15272 TaxID=585531 RepID=E2S8N6_9ACTN|nr:ABC transporter ATP-binding protein [Aeromicrobium marinum]EFQ84541.1 ABC transporter, ATP-binding protein [Aeromicrobium marinum DSM 15272]